MNDLYKLTATEAIQLISSGKISVKEWSLSCINRVEEKEKDIEAWNCFFPELILQNAGRIDEKIRKKENTGKLSGALVGIKDIFNTADMPTSMGSPIWKGFTPGNDARVIHYIREQNGIIAGKTVTAEFAVHHPNQTRNPWNKKHSPGTSSSGSAAAVAAGMVPLALGTQTAGSIIRPASYCGCYGYKPTFGTVPRTGMLKTTDTLDSVGLFARSANDCLILFDTIRVYGSDHPFIHKKLNDTVKQQKNNKLKWKIGIISDQFWTSEHVHDYARNAFNNFTNNLKTDKNIIVEAFRLNEEWNTIHEFHRIIYHKCLSYYFKEEFKNPSQISPVMAELIEEGNRITSLQYHHAIKKQTEFTNNVDALFDEYDAILTLSTAGEAPAYGTAIDPPDTCLIWTYAGTPSISVPLFRSPSNLPFGLQIISGKYSDYKLFNFIQYLIEIGSIDKKNIAFP